MTTQIASNIANFKSWNGKVYNNSIFVKGEKVTDVNRIGTYQAIANIINEMMNANYYGNDKTMAYVVLNKERIAVEFVSRTGITGEGVGYSIAGIIADELNNNRELTNTLDKMIEFIIQKVQFNG